MGYEFEGRNEAELDVSPEHVWQAIATGPGIDSWFMGRNEVEPGEGGAVRMTFGDYTPVHTVTGWDPQKRLAYRTEPDEDGRFIAYEFLIEGRERGSTVLRMVVNGFLPGDDWEDEYEAMTQGGELFFRTLVEYLRHFAGRTATPVTAFGPPVGEWAAGWATLRRALGLPDQVAEGDPVRVTPEGLPPIDGTVYFVNRQTLGIRTGDALYRFLQGFNGVMVVGHHIFAGADRHTPEAWQAWLRRLYA